MNNQESDLYYRTYGDELQEARAKLELYFDLALEVAGQDGASSNDTVDISGTRDTMTERSNININ